MDSKPRRKNYFITGLVAILPLALSLYILWIIFNGIGQLTSPLFHKIFDLLDIKYSTFLVNAVSVLLTFILIWFVGVLVTNIFGRRLFTFFENILVRVPILKGFYVSIRQLLDHFITEKMAFRQVVLVQYPRAGIYSIGFVTSETKGAINEVAKTKLVNIFVPTTPNPTSGMFVMVPKEELVYLKISIDDALRLVISSGLIAPSESKLVRENQ